MSASRRGFREGSDFGTLSGLRDSELTKLLGWPGYRVYRHEINERGKDAEALGPAQARQPEAGLLWMRAQTGRGARGQ